MAKMHFDRYRLRAAEGLRRWRRAAEMTQAELAKACGVSRKTVIRWEDPLQDHSPGVVHLLRLCDATGAIPEYLYRCLTCEEDVTR